MKYFFYLTILLVSCNSRETSTKQIPEIFVETTDPQLQNRNGTWFWKEQKFNGYILEKENDRLTAKLPVIDGKENGTAYGWYSDGKRRYERNFLNGNREGVQKGWHANDTLSFYFFFHEDKYEGEQKTYFKNGQPWQILNYVNGYEEGKQKSWNEDGRLINNFVVKNGKLYGVIGRYDCISAMAK